MSRRRLDLSGGPAARKRPDPADASATQIDLGAPIAAQLPGGAPPTEPDLPPASPLAGANETVGTVPPVAARDSPSTAGEAGPGGYVKRHLVHRGHLTSVWLASNPRRPGQWFALKSINREYLFDKSLQKRFEQEAAVGATIKNPHVARVVDSGRDAECPWLAMDYVTGPFDPEVVGVDWPRDLPPPPLTLDDYVRKHGTLSADQVTDLGIKLCLAVEAFHAAGIVHADIRPANVLWNAQRQPILIDLGLCRPMDAPDRMYLPTERMVDACFAASELKSDLACHDPRADLFSLAGTLVFVLTKRMPIHYSPESLPENLRSTLVKALEINPEARFPTVAAFGLALAGPAAPIRLAPERLAAPAPAGSSVKIIRRGAAEPPPSSSIKKLRRL